MACGHDSLKSQFRLRGCKVDLAVLPEHVLPKLVRVRVRLPEARCAVACGIHKTDKESKSIEY